MEVFSLSTATYDRGEKFQRYRTFPTLRQYILIDENRMSVTHYRQIKGFVWTLAGEYTQPDDGFSLPELDLQAPLSEIYRRVTFS